ncbi:hypothetical protein CAPTEDRAFT_224003 [Capitella teleta]|uniref:FAM86 N-terminal domain-containing protein n=1 Tax=Capitella teleta TaxID=283909 RepID=R7T7X9_CAPTE|nr:hypothetical protein CAPTEDRAFT_224003 [Capitella teleta]|eukprot:ELT89739.1 hypothetical protein CAPTEDRAFT_224003 [Capitella teleta]
MSTREVFTNWPSLEASDQEQLLCGTTQHSLSVEFPPSAMYRKRFLKHIISELEKNGTEIIEALYEEYTHLLSLSTEDANTCFKIYPNPSGKDFVLRESTNMISQGTTGLQTWPAAFCLAEWALENSDLLRKKRIIELGSGLGFAGMLIHASCQPEKYIFTDCHENVLHLLQSNINLNYSEKTEDAEWDPVVGLQGCYQLKSRATLCTLALNWETVNESDLSLLSQGADVIVAADVVYDSSIIPSLVRVLSAFLRSKESIAFIASTIRNIDTMNEFTGALEEASIEATVLSSPTNKVFVYDRSTPFRILQLRS